MFGVKFETSRTILKSTFCKVSKLWERDAISHLHSELCVKSVYSPEMYEQLIFEVENQRIY